MFAVAEIVTSGYAGSGAERCVYSKSMLAGVTVIWETSAASTCASAIGAASVVVSPPPVRASRVPEK